MSEPQRAQARASLSERLGDLSGLSFLDAGAGSGLFSDAARDLGAIVTSFDYDPARHDIAQGDLLDHEFMHGLGTFDVVYSWGVLHHTGEMWTALENVSRAVAPDGRLFISIYNDQGRRSRQWRLVKHWYQRVPSGLRPGYVAVAMAPRTALGLVRDAIHRRNYLRTLMRQDRGMSPWRDMVDWVGGYPFEVALPDEVFNFCHARGFELEWLRTIGDGSGCNEFVFRKRLV